MKRLSLAIALTPLSFANVCLAQPLHGTLRTEFSLQPSVTAGSPFSPPPIKPDIVWKIPPSQWHAESLQQAGMRVEISLRDVLANERMTHYKTPSTDITSQAMKRLAALRAAKSEERKTANITKNPSDAKASIKDAQEGVSKISDPPVYPDYLSPEIVAGAAHALKVIPEMIAPFASLRCTSVQLHAAHHTFPLLGRMCHLQLNCYFAGAKGSGFQVRVPLPELLCPKQ